MNDVTSSNKYPSVGIVDQMNISVCQNQQMEIVHQDATSDVNNKMSINQDEINSLLQPVTITTAPETSVATDMSIMSQQLQNEHESQLDEDNKEDDDNDDSDINCTQTGGNPMNCSNLKTEGYCDFCRRNFCNKYYLKRHKLEVHGVHSSNDKPTWKRSKNKDKYIKDKRMGIGEFPSQHLHQQSQQQQQHHHIYPHLNPQSDSHYHHHHHHHLQHQSNNHQSLSTFTTQSAASLLPSLPPPPVMLNDIAPNKSGLTKNSFHIDSLNLTAKSKIIEVNCGLHCDNRVWPATLPATSSLSHHHMSNQHSVQKPPVSQNFYNSSPSPQLLSANSNLFFGSPEQNISCPYCFQTFPRSHMIMHHMLLNHSDFMKDFVQFLSQQNQPFHLPKSGCTGDNGLTKSNKTPTTPTAATAAASAGGWPVALSNPVVNSHNSNSSNSNNNNNNNNNCNNNNSSSSILQLFYGQLINTSGPINDRVKCDVCYKDICNKYYLKLHKQRMHNSSSSNGLESEFKMYLNGELGSSPNCGDNNSAGSNVDDLNGNAKPLYHKNSFIRPSIASQLRMDLYLKSLQNGSTNNWMYRDSNIENDHIKYENSEKEAQFDLEHEQEQEQEPEQDQDETLVDMASNGISEGNISTDELDFIEAPLDLSVSGSSKSGFNSSGFNSTSSGINEAYQKRSLYSNGGLKHFKFKNRCSATMLKHVKNYPSLVNPFFNQNQEHSFVVKDLYLNAHDKSYEIPDKTNFVFGKETIDLPVTDVYKKCPFSFLLQPI